MLDCGLPSREKRSCHSHLSWDCLAWCLLQRCMKELVRLCQFHLAPFGSRQLYKTLKGVISGEQQCKGTPGKLLGSLGSHKASGSHSSVSFTWSCGLAAFHWVAGIRGCVWKTTTLQACLETRPKWPNIETPALNLILSLTLSKSQLTKHLKPATCNGLKGACEELRWSAVIHCRKGKAKQHKLLKEWGWTMTNTTREIRTFHITGIWWRGEKDPKPIVKNLTKRICNSYLRWVNFMEVSK